MWTSVTSLHTVRTLLNRKKVSLTCSTLLEVFLFFVRFLLFAFRIWHAGSPSSHPSVSLRGLHVWILYLPSRDHAAFNVYVVHATKIDAIFDLSPVSPVDRWWCHSLTLLSLAHFYCNILGGKNGGKNNRAKHKPASQISRLSFRVSFIVF